MRPVRLLSDSVVLGHWRGFVSYLGRTVLGAKLIAERKVGQNRKVDFAGLKSQSCYGNEDGSLAIRW